MNTYTNIYYTPNYITLYPHTVYNKKHHIDTKDWTWRKNSKICVSQNHDTLHTHTHAR